MTMFDWQVVRHSRGPRDLAYFLSISVSVEQRRTPEESLLGSYYEALKANGVERYSTRDFRHDFQAGLVVPLTTLVIAGGMVDFSNERGTACSGCRANGLALDDHRVMRYLDELPDAALVHSATDNAFYARCRCRSWAGK